MSFRNPSRTAEGGRPYANHHSLIAQSERILLVEHLPRRGNGRVDIGFGV
jgi:hypothetical protein